MYEAAASCKNISRAPITNWEPRDIMVAGYYAVRYRMKVQLVTPYHVTRNITRLRYAVTLQMCSAHNSVSCHSLATLRGNVTNVCSARNSISCHLQCYEVTLHGNVTSVYPP